MAYPKIIYPGAIGDVTLQFTYPNINKPGPQDGNSDLLRGQVSDSLTLSGDRQRIWWRTDVLRPLEMESVPVEDLADWKAFFDFAIPGDAFDYYPDADSDDHLSCVLEDTDWDPQRNVRGIAKFKLTLRLPSDNGT